MTAEVFLSFAGPDRESAQLIRAALETGRVRGRRLSVWLDESLAPGDGVTAGIELAPEHGQDDAGPLLGGLPAAVGLPARADRGPVGRPAHR